MNAIEDNTNAKLNTDDLKKHIPMDLNQISNIVLRKINNIKPIDDVLIEEICTGLKLYCQNHNQMINDWFDENYFDDLKTFKTNNENHLKLSNIFGDNSFISVNYFN